MTMVVLRDVSNFVLKRVSAVFPSGGLSVIVGPNGAGKTTLLKVIAGLTGYEGSIFFDGECIDDLEPYERGVSYVPQNNALFLNLRVWDNIAFGLRARGFGEKYVVSRVNRLVAMLGLEGIVDRYPATLSGGEARKVALARALAVDPRVLLLDEPFTNLDIESQAVVEQEVMMIVKKLERTVILVTHTIEKAVANAEKMFVLWGGSLVFSGRPVDLDSESLPEDARYFLGSVIRVDNVFYDNGLCYAELGGYKISLSCHNSFVSGTGKVFVPASGVRISKRGLLRGRVSCVRRSGSRYRVCVEVGDGLLYMESPFRLRVGEVVGLRIEKAFLLGGGS